MSGKTTHEPEEEVMSTDDVWDDAQRLHELFRQRQGLSEQVVHLQVPLAAFLAALDSLSQDDLLRVRERVEQRLAG